MPENILSFSYPNVGTQTPDHRIGWYGEMYEGMEVPAYHTKAVEDLGETEFFHPHREGVFTARVWAVHIDTHFEGVCVSSDVYHWFVLTPEEYARYGEAKGG